LKVLASARRKDPHSIIKVVYVVFSDLTYIQRIHKLVVFKESINKQITIVTSYCVGNLICDEELKPPPMMEVEMAAITFKLH
jgi:hypothetical protein